MKSVILLGTSRQNGNTHVLAQSVASRLGCTLLDLSNYDISPFDYTHGNRHDDFLNVFRELAQYDHIALATPVYWYSPSAQMKTFLDRLSDLLTIEKDLGRSLRGKSLSFIATGSDTVEPGCFNEIFERTAHYLGMAYWPGLYCGCPQDIVLADHSDAISAYTSRVGANIAVQ